MSTYFEYVFGFSSDIYELLANGYGEYNSTEFMQLLTQAKIERDSLRNENETLKKEIAMINQNFVTTLERDLAQMRKTLDKVVKPKYTTQKTVEQLDV